MTHACSHCGKKTNIIWIRLEDGQLCTECHYYLAERGILPGVDVDDNEDSEDVDARSKPSVFVKKRKKGKESDGGLDAFF